MQTIEFNAHVNEGTIKIPANYQNWNGEKIKVILLRQDNLTSENGTSIESRPIGLAKNRFQVPPQFFEELPEDLINAFESKK